MFFWELCEVFKGNIFQGHLAVADSGPFLSFFCNFTKNVDYRNASLQTIQLIEKVSKYKFPSGK